MGKPSVVKRFRDSHHLLARLFAAGLRPGEVAARAGYSLSRVSILSGDPAFQELIASYRGLEDTAFAVSRDQYWDRATRARDIALRLVEDKLEDASPDEVSFRELLNIHDSMADRTGYGKRATQININADFASMLDKAIARSGKTIEGTVLPTLASPALGQDALTSDRRPNSPASEDVLADPIEASAPSAPRAPASCKSILDLPPGGLASSCPPGEQVLTFRRRF